MASPCERRGRTAVLLAAGAIAASSALTACGSGPDPSTATTEGHQIEGIVRPDPLQVGDLSLPEVGPDGTETPFAFKAERGELLFVAFGYTNCPDVCPTTLYDIKKARKRLGADGDQVQVAFVTVDPERDTAEVVDQYLGSFATDGHPLRTDDREELDAVQDGFGITSSVVKNPDGSTDVAHTARSFVVDDQGDVVVEWSFGTGADVMADDLRLLLDQEAASS